MQKRIITVIALLALVGCAQKSTDSATTPAADETGKAKADAPKVTAPAPAKVTPTATKTAPTPAKAPTSQPAGAKAPTSMPMMPPKPAPLPAPSDVAAAPADAQKMPSGLASKVIKAGTGKVKPAPTDKVKVHYTGWTTDGKMFDSSRTRGKPITFPLNRVIKGWTEGVGLMVVGEQRRLWIPAKMAYGEKPRPGAPAGNLTFDVELLEIVKADTPDQRKAKFQAFSAAASRAADAVCGCKDMACARAAMMMMASVKPPDGQPTPAELKLMTPTMERLQKCGQKLQAAAAPRPKFPAPGAVVPPGGKPIPVGKPKAIPAPKPVAPAKQ